MRWRDSLEELPENDQKIFVLYVHKSMWPEGYRVLGMQAWADSEGVVRQCCSNDGHGEGSWGLTFYRGTFYEPYEGDVETCRYWIPAEEFPSLFEIHQNQIDRYGS